MDYINDFFVKFNIQFEENHIGIKNLSRIIEILEEHTPNEFDNGVIWRMYGIYKYYIHNDFEKTRECLKKAVYLNDLHAYIILGSIYEKQNKCEMALKAYNCALKNEYTLAYYYIGQLHLNKKD